MYRFNGFNDKANKVLNNAFSSAQDLGHTYIGSEHILLGILKEPTCIAYQILKDFGITKKSYYNKLTKKIPCGMPVPIDISDLTPRAKKILENSLKINNNITLSGTDCLILSILEEKSSLAFNLLETLGLDVQSAKKKIKNYYYLEYIENKYTKKKNTKLLDGFTVNLNEKAAVGKIDPLIGRNKEIERILQIVSRRTKNNPCLLGDPGVGKTAIVEGLALKIVQHDVPEFLSDKKILSLNLTHMVAGTRYRGDFEERVKNILNEVTKDSSIILFIDEIHSIIGTGSAEGSPDIANILKPYLTNRELQIIGASTVKEYRKYIAKDPALNRRFLPIEIKEPSISESINIIDGIKDKYETFHNIKITYEAIISAVKLSDRYITDRFLPDKAIDIIDEAASKLKISNLKLNLLPKHDTSENNTPTFQDYNFFSEPFSNNKLIKHSEKNILTPSDIQQVVSFWSGIPITELTQEESIKLYNMEKNLKKSVIGQNEAIKVICSALKRNRTGIKDSNRPIGSFVFLGTTGVGKTKLCKSLAKLLFGKENSLIKFDMSEFMEKHTVSRLIGSPPGYVGSENGGELTEKINRNPYSIILFDEIEK
ncbi:MAG: ATP-dependent Clp protease ATP-binding subunit, partial [Clostridia bacterium]|nr:ATP-dependent Clp protease ATP-binding subunit [Clostridia bacterium]